MSAENPSIRQRLRKAKSFHPEIADFDTGAVPEHPLRLVMSWLIAAIDGEVGQPQAMTLSTLGTDGQVDARTLLLKDVDTEAVWFATSSISPKGQQISVHPEVALTLFWREQGRQIRMRGVAEPGPRDVSVADFTARHPASRAVATAMPQSDPIDDPEDARNALSAARERIDADLDFAPDDWTAYRVVPTSVEFWQATTGRDQIRLRYDRLHAGSPWTRQELWP